MSQETFLLIDKNIDKLKALRRSLFMINLDGAVSTKLLSQREVELAVKLGSALLAHEAAQSEDFRIEGLKKEIEEAQARKDRSNAVKYGLELEINNEYTVYEAADFFNFLDRLEGKNG